MEKITEKIIPAMVFATHRRFIDSYAELFELCPNVIGPEMTRLGCNCPEKGYCFTIDYNKNIGSRIDIEYYEAVLEPKQDSELIKFKELPQTTALCINHYGAYENFPTSFAKLSSYLEANGYQASDNPRFCYIDGIWNKESVNEWLTEIQIPVKK